MTRAGIGLLLLMMPAWCVPSHAKDPGATGLKIYITPADVPALLKRYERDFPEHGK